MESKAGTPNKNKKTLIALGAFAIGLVAVLAYNPLDYEYQAGPLPETFDAYLAERLTASEAAGVRPDNEERLVRYAPKTEYAILFIHGFGASRAEGELVIDQIGEEFQANTYYMRLPGHGTDKERHAAVKYTDYIDATEAAFAMMSKLGEKIIISGSSTGALLAAYLAAQHPDEVHAIILGSPLFEFKDPTSAIFTLPGGMLIVNGAFGEIRDANWGEDPEKRKQPGYEDYWLTTQYYSALQPLAELRKYIVQDHILGRITTPSLLLYYYKDEERQDQVVDVQGNLEHFASFGKLQGGAHPESRAVAVADGNHILMSEYVRTDKELILNSIRDFLRALEK
ncbi:MAG: alpha/beta hydrolase [bacterium]|nr:alpha/beta hydrolase [bacterium]